MNEDELTDDVLNGDQEAGAEDGLNSDLEEQPSEAELDAFEAELADRKASADGPVKPNIADLDDDAFEALMNDPGRFGPEEEEAPYVSPDGALALMTEAEFDHYMERAFADAEPRSGFAP